MSETPPKLGALRDRLRAAQDLLDQAQTRYGAAREELHVALDELHAAHTAWAYETSDPRPWPIVKRLADAQAAYKRAMTKIAKFETELREPDPTAAPPDPPPDAPPPPAPTEP